MRKLVFILFLIISCGFSTVYAQQQSDDLPGVCDLADGTWTGNPNGNWACCWSGWGCYGCHSSVCKMQCRTQRCRDANRIGKQTTGTKIIKGLAPAGAVAPIAPIRAKNKMPNDKVKQ
jgi:hypothetical protein